MKHDYSKPFDPLPQDFDVEASGLLPPRDEIPDEYQRHNNKANPEPGTPEYWLKTVEDWFFKGMLIKKAKPKDGIDANKALAHIDAIIKSFSPCHNHKTYGVAWLFSLWFDEFEYEVTG